MLDGPKKTGSSGGGGQAFRPADSVNEALQEAAKTGQTNTLVAVIQRNPFVKKAGRSERLNAAAKKKGGIASMRTVCVRASFETGDQIQKLYEKLPAELQGRFLAGRGYDFRAFTAPPQWSIYLFEVLFGSGEKWSSEGIANPDNCDKVENQDHIAATRAFSRTVGFGTADGLISDDLLAGSEDIEDADTGNEVEADEQAVMVDHSRNRQAEEDAKLSRPVPKVLLDEEAAPDGDDPFRTPDSGGSGGAGTSAANQAGTPGPATSEGGSSPAGGGAPDAAGGPAGAKSDGGNPGPDGQPTGDSIDPVKLIALARQKGVYAVKYASTKCGREIKALNELTDFERSILWDDLSAMPDKPAK